MLRVRFSFVFSLSPSLSLSLSLAPSLSLSPSLPPPLRLSLSLWAAKNIIAKLLKPK